MVLPLLCVLTALRTITGIIVFPDDENKAFQQDIPLDWAMKIDSRIEDDVADLVRDLYPDAEEDTTSFRFGGSTPQIKISRPPRCMPTSQVVELESRDEQATVLFPACTRVPRCSGCCSNDLLDCQPVSTEVVQVGAVVGKYEGTKRKTSRELIEVQQHTECRCDCKVKPMHCRDNQFYSADSCRCLCRNSQEEMLCAREFQKKMWNSRECMCLCREEHDCSTGMHFDHRTCRCSNGGRPRRPFMQLYGYL